MKAILILSGGLDSSTLAYWLKENGYSQLICITYNYGQRQRIEIEAAKTIAANLNATHHILDITFLKPFFKGSSLTNEKIQLPHGRYNQENMQSTVVPNRNSILLSMAWSIACTEQADVLAYGAHGGDHYLYPDTRPEYFMAMNQSLRLGTQDCRKENLNLIAPFLTFTKAQIIKIGNQLNVPFANTWTCYAGGGIHCGLCPSCHNRKQGFIEAKVYDPTIYQQ